MKRSVLFLSLLTCTPVAHQLAPENHTIDAGLEHYHTLAEDLRVCPRDMIEVEGDYCPDVKQTCLQWVNSQGDVLPPPEDGTPSRCGTFERPTKCLSAKVHKRFCIDRFEYPNHEGETPTSWLTWFDVKRGCEDTGKRLCTRSEWTFACEGPEMHPLPYGDGYHRDDSACNIDNPAGAVIDVFKATSSRSHTAMLLDALLVPSGEMSSCVSPFGVHDMPGNIDEFVVNETGQPHASGLMGGHVFGVRNACRPMTDGHGPNFSWYETGGRCCRSPD